MTKAQTPTVADFMTPETASHCVPMSHSVREAAAFLEQRKVRHIPVVDVERRGSQVKRLLIGIVSDRDIFRAMPREEIGTPLIEDPGTAKRQTLGNVVTYNPETVEKSTPLKKAAELMLAHKIDALPVVEGEDRVFVGIITSSDLLRAITREDLAHGQTVAGISSTKLITVGPSSTLRDSIEHMQNNLIRHLPVLDPNGLLVGIVSDRQLLRCLLAFAKSTAKTKGTPKFRQQLFQFDETEFETQKVLAQPISSVMEKDFVTASAQHSIEAVALQMLQHRIDCVPLLDPETRNLEGIVTRTDLVKFAVTRLRESA